MTKPVEPTGLALLRAPFPPNQISKLPKASKAQNDALKADFKKGIRCQVCGGWHLPEVVHLDYVGHAALTDRLLDVDPHWFWEPLAFNNEGLPAFDRNGGLWIRLTVLGQSRIGYGGADGKQGTDAVKEIIGDALRNAAMRFGAALDLWHKGDLHLDGDEPAPVETARPAACITDAQRTELIGMLETMNVAVGAFLQVGNISDLRELPAGEFETAKRWINKQAKAKQPSVGNDIADEIPY